LHVWLGREPRVAVGVVLCTLLCSAGSRVGNPRLLGAPTATTPLRPLSRSSVGWYVTSHFSDRYVPWKILY